MHGGDEHNSVEAYSNTIIGYMVDWRNTYGPAYIGQYLDRGIRLRGGSALIYDNIITDCPREGVALVSDTSDLTDYVWIWGNIITYPNAGSGTDFVKENTGTHVYYREPNILLDGFYYTPYTYPHPLTLGVTPTPSITPTPTNQPTSTPSNGGNGQPTPAPSNINPSPEPSNPIETIQNQLGNNQNLLVIMLIGCAAFVLTQNTKKKKKRR